MADNDDFDFRVPPSFKTFDFLEGDGVESDGLESWAVEEPVRFKYLTFCYSLTFLYYKMSY